MATNVLTAITTRTKASLIRMIPTTPASTRPREREMPLRSYTWAHADARLSKDQRERLAGWFEEAASR